jgi:hypothetical protein
MDVENGKFQFDFRTGQVKSDVSRNGYLAPEIAGEGEKVLMSDGSVISFNPPSNKPIVPDWSEIKSIKKYFNRTDFHIWPHWFYHPTEDAIVLRNAEEAAQLGIRRRESTMEERARTNCGPFIWEWPDECLWRPTPYVKAKFDPRNPGHGKNYVREQLDHAAAQSALLKDLVEAFKGGGGPATITGIDPTLAAEFAAFQAWREANKPGGGDLPADHHERQQFELRAKELGVKVDGRWSLERLKKEVATVSAAIENNQPEQAA